ncbi:hypothetical protein L6452_20381 [Arctium lappa]|uniref:Uncharacterized protein n=1 Tax=Arctium lappa TaxID=4217 RepID=A0ACB9BB71_ARCLA|nr:hypothetical protein L6452_20381 [Arctium lappa]
MVGSMEDADIKEEENEIDSTEAQNSEDRQSKGATCDYASCDGEKMDASDNKGGYTQAGDDDKGEEQ